MRPRSCKEKKTVQSMGLVALKVIYFRDSFFGRCEEVSSLQKFYIDLNKDGELAFVLHLLSYYCVSKSVSSR